MRLKRIYRVVHHKNREYRYGIHEVVTTAEGKLVSVSERPLSMTGMSIEEILDMLEQLLETVDQPAMDYDLFPAIEWDLPEAIHQQ